MKNTDIAANFYHFTFFDVARFLTYAIIIEDSTPVGYSLSLSNQKSIYGFMLEYVGICRNIWTGTLLFSVEIKIKYS